MEAFQQQGVLFLEGMNKGVGPDPAPFSGAGGSGAVAPCSYLKIKPKRKRAWKAAKGGDSGDRHSPLPCAMDYETWWSGQYEIENDGETKLKDTQYLTVNVTNRTEPEIVSLRNRFPSLNPLQLQNCPFQAAEHSIYRIDKRLTFYNLKTRLNP